MRGDASSTLRETAVAGEREASDLIHRDRIPRQYHKAIREYFSNLKGASGAAEGSGESVPDDSSEGTSDKSSEDPPLDP